MTMNKLVNWLFHSGYSVYIIKAVIKQCESPVCFMFPTAVCTFRSGERIFRSGKRTFRSGERTYRTAEYKIETCSYKIITALVNNFRQLLSHIHYYYLDTINMSIISRVRAHAHVL